MTDIISQTQIEVQKKFGLLSSERQAADFMSPAEISVVIYHGDCFDGTLGMTLVSGFCLPLRLCLPMAAGGRLPCIEQFLPEDRVSFIDVCPPVEDLEALAQVVTKVLVIDHHFGAKEYLEPWLGGPRNRNRCAPDNLAAWMGDECGAMMTWKYLMPSGLPENIPKFVRYVNEDDLGRWQTGISGLPNAKEFATALATVPKEASRYSELLDDARCDELIAAGAAMQRYVDVQVRQIADTAAKYPDCEGKKVAVVNSNTCFINDVAATLYRENPDLDYVLAFRFDCGERLMRVSLRSSKEGADVQSVAKRHRGNGHKAAAAWREELPPELVKKLLS
ncbi:MAG: hypothetical protein ACYCOU_10750 [Sulfobacillus sp.]